MLKKIQSTINLANYGSTLKLKGSEACGEYVAEMQSMSMKQEVNYKVNLYAC